MKLTLKILDKERDISFEKTITKSSPDEEKTIDDFILELLQISEEKRKLPLKIVCPNGLEVYPKIKMKFEGYGSSILGDKLEAMHITWN